MKPTRDAMGATSFWAVTRLVLRIRQTTQRSDAPPLRVVDMPTGLLHTTCRRQQQISCESL